jgi:hypothetical protein
MSVGSISLHSLFNEIRGIVKLRTASLRRWSVHDLYCSLAAAWGRKRPIKKPRTPCWPLSRTSLTVFPTGTAPFTSTFHRQVSRVSYRSCRLSHVTSASQSRAKPKLPSDPIRIPLHENAMSCAPLVVSESALFRRPSVRPFVRHNTT